MTTLRELIEEHPEWMDYDIVVYNENCDSCLNYSPRIYESDEMIDQPNMDCVPSGKKLLVFSGD